MTWRPDDWPPVQTTGDIETGVIYIPSNHHDSDVFEGGADMGMAALVKRIDGLLAKENDVVTMPIVLWERIKRETRMETPAGGLMYPVTVTER